MGQFQPIFGIEFLLEPCLPTLISNKINMDWGGLKFTQNKPWKGFDPEFEMFGG
jgi:hypothetical protein